MVTFMDISIFTYLGPIFMFLFVFAIAYGFLSMLKIFKGVPGEQGLYGLISLVIALFVIISKDAFMLIGTFTPWFTVLIVFLFLVFLVVKMFVGNDDKLFASMLKEGALKWVMIVLFIIILIIALSSTFGQDMLETGSGNSSNQAVTPSVTPTTTTNGVEVLPSEQTQYQTVINPNTGTTTTQPVADTSTNNFSGNVLATFVNPKVLGMLLLMIIGFFTMLLLTQSSD